MVNIKNELENIAYILIKADAVNSDKINQVKIKLHNLIEQAN